MSVIVAVKDKENHSIYLGSDTFGANSSQWTINVRSDPKVFIGKLPLALDKGTNGFCDIGFGCTSSYRMIQLLQYVLNVPEWDRKVDTAMEWMVKKFVPAIKQLFKDEGFASVKENKESGGDFLVAFQEHLFEVNGDYQVIDYENQNYAACGCGEQFAYGSLFAHRDRSSVSAEFKCKDAIRAAIEFSAYCNGSTNIIEVK